MKSNPIDSCDDIFMDEKKPLSDAFKVAALPNDSPTKALGKA